MWQRFTEQARRIVFFAQEEAIKLGQDEVCTEHFLLGLVRENDTVAAKTLESLGVSLDQIRDEVETRAERGEGRLRMNLQLSPRGKRVIDLAYDEARQLWNNYIGTEHLLLGLLCEGEDRRPLGFRIFGFPLQPPGVASQTLRSFGLTPEQVRNAIRALPVDHLLR